MTLTPLEHQYRIVNPIHFNPKYDLATRFESVEKTLSEERAKIDGQRAGEKEDANKQSTQTLTIRYLKRREDDGNIQLRRLDTSIREFRLLHYNLTAARAFFQVIIIFNSKSKFVFIKVEGDTGGDEEDTASVANNS